VVQFYDAITKYLIPLAPTANRVWTATWVQQASYLDVSSGTASTSIMPLQIAGVIKGSAGLPTAFLNRPVVAEVSPVNNIHNFWVDANPAAVATAAVQVIYQKPNTGAWTVYCALSAWQAPGVVNQEYQAAPQTTVTSTSGNMTFNFNIVYSGWYSARILVAPATSSGVFSIVGGTMILTESTTVASGYFLSQSLITANTLLGDYFVNGTALLLSSKFPSSNLEGDILAARLDTMPGQWWEQLSSLSTVFAALQPCEKYNKGAGGPLSKGLYSYASPVSWPVTLSRFGGDSDALSQSLTTLNDNSGVLLSRLLPSIDVPVGVKAASILITSELTSTPKVPMTFTAFENVVVLPYTQLLAARVPARLLSDQWDVARDVLESLPQFTENPAHAALGNMALGFLKQIGVDALQAAAKGAARFVTPLIEDLAGNLWGKWKDWIGISPSQGQGNYNLN